MRRCSYCHTMVNEDNQFCPECGRPMAIEQAIKGKSKKKLVGIIVGVICIIAIIIIVIKAASPDTLPRPTIDYMHTNWSLLNLTPYEEGIYEGQYDNQSGAIQYINQVTYDNITIFYERAPKWDLTPIALEQDADGIFRCDLGYIPDETGIMPIAGKTAGYAKGYDSGLDLYDLELVLVLDQVYVEVYAVYYPSEVEDQIFAMIDSISL